MSDVIVAIGLAVCFIAFVSGCTYTMSENNKQNTETERQLNASCLNNGGSIMFDSNGRRQCIRFAK